MTIKSSRPTAGLGLGSAMTSEQIVKRASAKPTTARSGKPKPVRSSKPSTLGASKRKRR